MLKQPSGYMTFFTSPGVRAPGPRGPDEAKRNPGTPWQDGMPRGFLVRSDWRCLIARPSPRIGPDCASLHPGCGPGLGRVKSALNSAILMRVTGGNADAKRLCSDHGCSHLAASAG